MTTQEFAASPVRLPAAVQDGLVLPEGFTDTLTRTRRGTFAGQEVEVTITNQVAGYGRSFSGPVVWTGRRPLGRP